MRYFKIDSFREIPRDICEVLLTLLEQEGKSKREQRGQAVPFIVSLAHLTVARQCEAELRHLGFNHKFIASMEALAESHLHSGQSWAHKKHMIL